MNETAAILESTVRGGAATLALLLTAVLIRPGPGARSRYLAALFTGATAIYTLISGDPLRVAMGDWAHILSVLAVAGTCFFWWFAASIFDDRFQWRWWRFAPLIILVGSFLIRYAPISPTVEAVRLYAHVLLNALLFADVLRLAWMNAADDLVGRRRLFRFAVSVSVGVFGIAIAIAEMFEGAYELPNKLRYIQAGALYVLFFVFAFWLLKSRNELFLAEVETIAAAEGANPTKSQPTSKVPAADQATYQRLQDLMDAGLYLEEGLTVGKVADRVGAPEHQLRRLINRELGFRNFSSFLNARRIADAQNILADRNAARRQVLEIALELGYGSIAPFNRAFKEATGKTPTEYRRDALNGTGQKPGEID